MFGRSKTLQRDAEQQRLCRMQHLHVVNDVNVTNVPQMARLPSVADVGSINATQIEHASIRGQSPASCSVATCSS